MPEAVIQRDAISRLSTLWFQIIIFEKMKKIIWLTSSFVVIGILIYFAIQLFVVAEESLHLAATQGNLNSISVLIKKGKDVNQSTSKGFTPLHAATIGGHEEAIKLLLDNGALIDPREKEENRTPLHIATQNGNKRIVELLISRGADINARAIANTTPLHIAVTISNEEIVELLLKNGADTTILANIRDTQYSPLQLAEIRSNENIIKLLKKNKSQ
jgi:ankyrin repeat protein